MLAAARYPPTMADIVLATLNARWSHASLGLRCLRANLGPLRDSSAILEFVIRTPADAVVQRILAERPRVVGFGVYIWNVTQTTEVVRRLKQRAPQVAVVVGGPEVSHEIEQQSICRLADHVVAGWGEVTFRKLAAALLHGPRPLMKVHAGAQPPLEALALPYGEYTDADLARRYVYVEASRGCPFKCEFCLSALDRTAWPFRLEPLLAALADLYARGGRHFKFVDRTFNLKIDTAARILEFFLALIATHPDDPPFAHFELIPDRLPARLRDLVARFAPGTLQFEIGIQTFNPDTQRAISREQDNGVAESNLRWLRAQTSAHLHVDLIAGLPGEDLPSFAQGFNRLVALGPHEIQGMLKRLRGAPIVRRSDAYRMRYSIAPPYEVVSTDALDAAAVERLRRFARYWDLVGNSGRFHLSLPLIVGDDAFARFSALAEYLYRRSGRTYGLAAERLYQLVYGWLVEQGGVDGDTARTALASDYRHSGARGALVLDGSRVLARGAKRGEHAARQLRHVYP
jgi:radical SAM superfamily enzyme YgiQ (UPF0313 family)